MADGTSGVSSSDIEVIDAITRWRHDPVLFVRQVFGQYFEQSGEKIDAWQEAALRGYLLNKRTAMKACKGPGKSTVLAWIGWHMLMCFPHCQGNALSITQDNLRDNLWKELALWHGRSDLIQRGFRIHGEKIFQVDHPKTWWLTARAFAQSADANKQANTLAGLHSDHVFLLLDEIGDYPQGVVDAAEGIFAVKGQFARVIAAGNPTSVDGPLYRICTVDAERWKVITITGDPDDVNRSPRIDIVWAREQIAARGREDPVIMVNILGLFPSKGFDKLIHPDWVSAAQVRDIPRLSFLSDPIIWGLDCARFGDDKSALARRQGYLCRKLMTWHDLDGPQLAGEVIQVIQNERKEGRGPDAIFIDAAGVGASAYDAFKTFNYGSLVIPIDFAQRAASKNYHNKRAEIWDLMKDWLKSPMACLPTDPELVRQLTGVSMAYRTINKKTALLLQSKEDLRKEGLPSPDKGDAIALTFAGTVQSKATRYPTSGGLPVEGSDQKFCETKYDVFNQGVLR